MEKRRFEKGIALGNKKENVKPFWSLCRRRLNTRKGVAPLQRDPQDPNSITFDDIEKAEETSAK